LKHVEDSNKYTIEEIVRQVGYLLELYEDARSKKYKKLTLHLNLQSLPHREHVFFTRE